jgi:proline iminopeptidase
MGRDDVAVPHTLWNTVLPELHDGSFHLFGDSGHTPQLEQPEAFDRLLLERPHA